MDEILSPGRERVIFLKLKLTPRYSNCCLGMRFDFFQFTCIPKFWNSFKISFDSCINLSGDMAVIKKSSSRQKLMTPLLWISRMIGLIIRVNAHGAKDRPNGMYWNTRILLSITKAKYLWKSHAMGIRKKASFKSIIIPHKFSMIHLLT